MTKNPKVLVGSPVYSNKKYISPYWIEKVKDLSYPNYDILVIDNSKPSEKFGHIFEKRGIKVKYSPSFDDPFRRLFEARKMLNHAVIEGGYDYFLSIEQDVIVPEQITELLMKHQVPIVGAPYIISAHTNEQRRMVDFIISASKLDKVYDIIDGVTVNEWYLADEIKNKGLLQVKSCSLGCTLVKTEVLKKIPVRFNNEVKRADDSYFFQDCSDAGIPVYLDTDLLWHIDHIKRLGGEIPVGKEIKLIKEKKLEVIINGESKHF
ncbi:glycosyltransferase family 2 protein [Candidatus Woesearchaeota archaeon]|nr:glycosyltransferase family 2 protein [Candidatus Woesearchaeota archaeon]